MAKPKVTLTDHSVIIEITLDPKPSKSMKSLVLASTEGNVQTEASYNGKSVVVGANVYIPRD